MADEEKPFYRAEHVLRAIGGRETEYRVWSSSLEDVFDEGYKLTVRCQITDAQEEGIYAAGSKRRLKDVEFFLRRRFPDGQLLETRIAGLIDSITRDVVADPGKDGTNDTFTVVIVPALAQLKLDLKGGTWHNKSHADILYEELKKGLEPYGRTVRRQLVGNYPEVDFTVRQPHESLYDFALKLMARTGINFWFDFSQGVEQLVLCDSNDALPKITRRGSVPFRPQWIATTGSDNEERIQSVSRESGMQPSQVEFLGFDPQHPKLPLAGMADMTSLLSGIPNFSGIFGASAIPVIPGLSAVSGLAGPPTQPR